MSDSSAWVVIGRFGRPQGLKGGIRVISFSDPEQLIITYLPWHMRQNNRWVPVQVLKTDIQNRTLVAYIAGYEQREHVAELTNIDIGIDRSQLPTLAAEEYYWQDMLDIQVYTTHGVCLGTVTQLLPTGSNDVLVVSGKKRHLIPFVQGVYVMSVDLKQRRMIVEWDEDF